MSLTLLVVVQLARNSKEFVTGAPGLVNVKSATAGFVGGNPLVVASCSSYQDPIPQSPLKRQ